MRPTMRVMALAVVTCAVFGSSASASDAKVLAGAACQPRLPGDRDAVACTVTKSGTMRTLEGGR